VTLITKDIACGKVICGCIVVGIREVTYDRPFSMGTESYVLVGAGKSEDFAFSSACHCAGRSMSRTQVTKKWQGRKLIDELHGKGVLRSVDRKGACMFTRGGKKWY
jgi:hypothetical protein